MVLIAGSSVGDVPRQIEYNPHRPGVVAVGSTAGTVSISRFVPCAREEGEGEGQEAAGRGVEEWGCRGVGHDAVESYRGREARAAKGRGGWKVGAGGGGAGGGEAAAHGTWGEEVLALSWLRRRSNVLVAGSCTSSGHGRMQVLQWDGQVSLDLYTYSKRFFLKKNTACGCVNACEALSY